MADLADLRQGCIVCTVRCFSLSGREVCTSRNCHQLTKGITPAAKCSRGEKLRDMREASVAAHYASWFDFKAIPTLVQREVSDIPPREASGGFNHYAPDFVYRYRKLPALTQDELLALSHHYLCVAAERPDRPLGETGPPRQVGA